ncbi:hypothetical protein SARC_01187 [Sphaeroforma arctica JP610]|uniref:Translation machinery-associated protein 16 n=1 Tax=Sphaeroforma arctica JP610 TaxID=667725 RepID=A0A0L0GCR7_9EUKA|nr:hypothetical protein SARC_01187 [Sphaeroforma arctica JP610]KNC86681.1 hypothetical protein SARC_01187 [Sphaeroforma arctica JP610]|eukprot:XP_014160583.1 hypothetical protein SARC_01187 [Sphaeroforma arctica JP610]
MVKQLKVTKKVVQKKLKTLHPASREAKRQSRAMLRKENLIVTKVKQGKLEQRRCDTLFWFKCAIQEDTAFYTDADMCKLIELYASRHDAELAAIAASQRKGEPLKGPKNNRQMVLNLCKTEEFAALNGNGFEAPDLSTAAKTQRWRDWDGSLQFLCRLPKRRYYNQKSSQPVEVTKAAISGASKWDGKQKFSVEGLQK